MAPPLGRLVRENDDYSEWLSEIERAGGELAWIRKTKRFPPNATGLQRSPEDINASVLQSRKVREAVAVVACEQGRSEKDVWAEAKQIVQDMAQSFNLTAVRCVGYGVVKVIKQLFEAIYVNSRALQTLRQRLRTDSIVFMPTHKTYVDFMLLSLLCFHENVTLPAIAAGSDFQQSRFMGEALRRCGAFFMRRSFGKDALYWAVFSEYVQTHLVHADRPVEFFVEGTRSRIGKSLHPKYGLLQALLEPYLRAQVYDLVVVPVTMNYDKVLEEQLYAYELLGFPKPKETTSGLFKARHILSKNFGNVYMTFAEPISVRQYFQPRISRSHLSFLPDSEFRVDARTKSAIRRLGHEIVRIHNEHNVCSVWPLACLVVAELLDEAGGTGMRVGRRALVTRLEQLVQLAQRLGIRIQVHTSVQGDLEHFLALHADLFVGAETDVLELCELPVQKESGVARHLLQKAVTQVVFANYANQAMCFFAEVGMLAAAVTVAGEQRLRHLEADFSFLQSVFEREFVCVPGDSHHDFCAALERLEAAHVLAVHGDEVRIIDEETLFRIARVVTPFVRVYVLCARLLLARGPALPQHSGKSVVTLLQAEIARQIEADPEGDSHLRLSFLCSEVLKNAFHSFSVRGIVQSKPWGSLSVDTSALGQFVVALARFDDVVQADSVVPEHSLLRSRL